MVRRRVRAQRTESQDRRDLKVRFALAAVGAPVGAPRKTPFPADLEAALADGLVLAHRDATLAARCHRCSGVSGTGSTWTGSWPRHHAEASALPWVSS